MTQAESKLDIKNEQGVAGLHLPENITCSFCDGRGELSREDVLREIGKSDIEDEVKKIIQNVVCEYEFGSSEFFIKLRDEFKEKYHGEATAKLDELKRDFERTRTKADQDHQELLKQTVLLETELSSKKDELSELRGQLRKVPAMVGQIGEKEFEDACSTIFPHFGIERLETAGDFLVMPKLEIGGTWYDIGVPVLVDRKRNKKVTPADIDKILRDAKHRRCEFAFLVADDEDSLRVQDATNSVQQKGETLLIITTLDRWHHDMRMLVPYLRTLYQKRSARSVDYKCVLERKTIAVLAEMNRFGFIFKRTAAMRREVDKIDAFVQGSMLEIEKICSDNALDNELGGDEDEQH